MIRTSLLKTLVAIAFVSISTATSYAQQITRVEGQILDREGKPAEGCKQEYLDIAAELKPLLSTIAGFISIERFESLSEPGKLLSLSFWRDDEAVAQWRQLEQHRAAQIEGRSHVFADYRLRIASVIRDYGIADRSQAPADSRQFHA